MDPIEKYITELSAAQSDLLTALDRETNTSVVQSRMISGNIQGQLLEFFVRTIRPAGILEIGTFTGYATICMAAGMEGAGHIDTIEVDDERETLIRKYFDLSGLSDRISLHIGSALEIIPTLGKTYQMVFIDGDKREYLDYYRLLMGDTGGEPCVGSGSVIIADNVLWYGKVAEKARHNDMHTLVLQQFNEAVRNDTRVDNFILPLRDGLNIIRVL